MARAQIEKDWNIQFKEEAHLKTHQAQEEAELLMENAMAIIQAGDIEYGLEVINMAQELKCASLYHAYKAAAAGCIKKAIKMYDELLRKPEGIDVLIAKSQKYFDQAIEEINRNDSISLYLNALKLSQDAITRCTSVVNGQ